VVVGFFVVVVVGFFFVGFFFLCFSLPAIVFSVLEFTTFDYPFGNCKLFLQVVIFTV
jgi:hypothetical protein